MKMAKRAVAILIVVSSTIIAANAQIKRLTYGDLGAVDYVNPIIGANPAERRLQQLIFNGLMECRSVPIDRRYDLVYVPIIAQQYTFNPILQEHVFTIRDDVRFHDLTRLTAADVATTLRTLTDEDTLVGNPKFREYINRNSIRTVGNKVSFSLNRNPWNKMELFTFGIMQNSQLEAFDKIDFNPTAQGRQWAGLSAIRNPIGTGPFKVAADVPTGGVESLRLTRFMNYFDSSAATTAGGNISEITYRGYASSGLAKLQTDLIEGRINIALQTYALDLNRYAQIGFDNDSIYYIGFNYRDDRRISLAVPVTRGTGYEYRLSDLKLSDILLANEPYGDETIGRAFRRFIMEGVDRREFINKASDIKTGNDLDMMVQTSIFPFGPFSVREEAVQSAQKLPSTYSPETAAHIKDVLNRYLERRRLPFFNFTEKENMASFTTITGIKPPQGLFTLSSNPSQAFSLHMIYSSSDPIMYNNTIVRNFLIDSFLKMGIVLQLEAVDRFNFVATVERGDWDLILTSYDVPMDYDVSSTFSASGFGNQNRMRYSDPEINGIATNLKDAVGEVDFSACLFNLNAKFIEKLPAILLFGFQNEAGFLKSLFITELPTLELYSSDQFFFGETEKWAIN